MYKLQRRLNYNYLKPQNYYNRLLTFFFIISFTLTFTLSRFAINDFQFFLLRMIMLLFILLLIAVAVEYFQKGEYMSPVEIYDVEHFYNRLIRELSKGTLNPDDFIHKYNSKAKAKFRKVFDSKKQHVLSSIRKKDDTYIITTIDAKRMMVFYFFRFFSRKAINKIHVKEENDEYKIIRIE